jgi:hypothetical protein
MPANSIQQARLPTHTCSVLEQHRANQVESAEVNFELLCQLARKVSRDILQAAGSVDKAVICIVECAVPIAADQTPTESVLPTRCRNLRAKCCFTEVIR